MKSKIIRTVGALAISSGALLSTLALGGAANAATPAPEPGTATPQTICTTSGYIETYSDWAETVYVCAGQSRSVTVCLDGTYKYGDWVGTGTWTFWGECYANIAFSYRYYEHS